MARVLTTLTASVAVLAAAVVAAPPAVAAACPTVDPVTGAVTGLSDARSYSGCDLSGADLTGRVLSKVTFTGSNFDGASFVDSLLLQSSFTGTMNGTDFTRAVVDQVRISSTGGAGVLLRDAMLAGSSIQGVLPGVDARGADLSGATLSGTWTGALLDDAVLQAVSVSADLSSASLVGADLTAAVLQPADLTGADLSGSILTGATIYGSSMQASDLTGARVDGLRAINILGVPAHLPSGWRKAQSVLVGPHADLSDWVFDHESLAGADLRGADLSGTAFTEVDLRGADLSGADLRGSAVVRSDLTGARGVATVYTTAGTVWTESVCADGYLSHRHLGQSCTRPLDSVAPVPVLGALPRWSSASSLLSVGASGSDAGTATGALNYRLRWRSTAASGSGRFTSFTYGEWTMPVGGRLSDLPQPLGRRVCVSLQVRDMAFNVSAPSPERCYDVVFDSGGAAFDRSYRWAGILGGAWSGFEALATRASGESVVSRTKRYVRQVGVVATTCPTCGRVAVFVGSTRVGVISLRSRTRSDRSLLLLPRLPRRLQGQVRVVVVSSGRLVRLDSIAATGV
jgi:uncharacterized protein YjbI with pentapeptide repeats